MGDHFTVADAYLYIVLSWSGHLGIDIVDYVRVKAYYDGIAQLDVVKAAHARMATSPTTVV